MSQPPDPGRRLTQRIANSPFLAQMGFRVEAAEPGAVRIRLPYDEALTTARSALHGGAIGALADAAGALCAWSVADHTAQAGRTVSCDVSYLAGALGEDIFGEATILRRGKALIYSRVALTNAEGKPLARANHIFQFAARSE